MGDRFRRILYWLSCKKEYALLLAFWLCGLLCGTILAVKTSESYYSMMRTAADSPVSIVSLFVTALLPFLICAFAARSGRRWLLYVICFCKALIFSHGLLVAFNAFGSAGWLILPMLHFPDLVLTPFFCWFCIRNLINRENLFRDLGVCIAIWIIAGYLNFSFVSSFLAKLID